MRPASADDIPVLVHFMEEFYAEAGYTLDHAHAAQAFAALLTDARLGYIWLIQAGTEDVGHIVLTTRYAMEYGGFIACLDDLYVQPTWRNQGLSTAALQEVRSFCETAGIRALTVEVGFTNGPAQKVYRRVGFSPVSNRELLVLPLASPTHVVKTGEVPQTQP